jgi:hypothetical protein
VVRFVVQTKKQGKHFGTLWEQVEKQFKHFVCTVLLYFFMPSPRRCRGLVIFNPS